MGGITFSQFCACDPKKVTAQDAFERAQSAARYDHGHSGYTGTIAEKSSYLMVSPTAEQLAEFNGQEHPYEDYSPEDGLWTDVEDKWGPAGCIALDKGYLFYGWAPC